jgi:transcriptional regulator with XRE-family HTH domain
LIAYDPELEPFDEMLAAIGERAKQLRLFRNFTQQELAIRARVGSATVQRFEKTGHISMENALRIAFALAADDEFRHLFQPPKYGSLDEALAEPKKRAGRKRARKRA